MSPCPPAPSYPFPSPKSRAATAQREATTFLLLSKPPRLPTSSQPSTNFLPSPSFNAPSPARAATSVSTSLNAATPCSHQRARTTPSANLIGCDSLPEETPVCPVGECNKSCLCRETLMKQLKTSLLDGPNLSDQTNPDSENEHITDLPPLHLDPSFQSFQPLIPKLPPWFSVKPTCTDDCPCCDYCVPIRRGPGCDRYQATRLLPPFVAARRVAGCDILPATTPLCPMGECHNTCVCRESLLERLDGVFFKGGSPDLRVERRPVEHKEL
ncbi:hypothetical protein B0T18DRAFT_66395 [Schizothecium vesticola]|uniref:Uncharacterized protein n=1 Tax=Schizothecium vesticola TaxID=314040 RepID=A0AA40F4Z3_9PEZI|nr:hypothetical protein B0T18DRAFT_66395 [Schizothecium vesticola]